MPAEIGRKDDAASGRIDDACGADADAFKLDVILLRSHQSYDGLNQLVDERQRPAACGDDLLMNDFAVKVAERQRRPCDADVDADDANLLRPQAEQSRLAPAV